MCRCCTHVWQRQMSQAWDMPSIWSVLECCLLLGSTLWIKASKLGVSSFMRYWIWFFINILIFTGFGTIRERVGVAPIVEKLVENRLRWFGHLERRPVDAVVRRVDQMEDKSKAVEKDLGKLLEKPLEMI